MQSYLYLECQKMILPNLNLFRNIINKLWSELFSIQKLPDKKIQNDSVNLAVSLSGLLLC